MQLYMDCCSQLNLKQLISANSGLPVLCLLLNLTNLTFIVYWLASVSGGGCKFTLKSFVLTAFKQALRRVRAGKLTIARPPALITVSKSGFEPLGWSPRPTQKGLTWLKVNLCHTCVTIWIMEFCNLSEKGAKCVEGKYIPGWFSSLYVKWLLKSLHFEVHECFLTWNPGVQNA